MPTKTIKIVVDVEVPAIHLLNSVDYEVVETKQENTFAMIKREVILGTSNIKVGTNSTYAGTGSN